MYAIKESKPLRPTIRQKQVDRRMMRRLKRAYKNQETIIPKIIHFCWVGGNEKPDDILHYIVGWKKHFPEYRIIEWNESNFDLHYNDYVREAYDHKMWAFVSDVIRLYVLYHYGGIYLDTDVEILRPLDRFLNHRAFSSFESGNSEVPPFIATGLMASEKHGRWVGELLDSYKERPFKLPDGQLDLLPNPTPITEHTVRKHDLIRNNEFQDLGDVTVYPSEFFCPKNWWSKETNLTKDSYAIHHFAGSWVKTETLSD